ncbi:MAG: hypothetical protein U1E76_19100 [Planctomycetota bacterium]
MKLSTMTSCRCAALAMLLGSIAGIAMAQPVQTPPATSKEQTRPAALGTATLTARLIESEKAAMHGGACVEVQVAGVQLIDPATVNEKPRDGEGHLHYQIDDGPVVATTATKLAFHDLKPGPHKLKVMLAANDHTPLGPMQELTIAGDVKIGAAEHEQHGEKGEAENKGKAGDTLALAKEKPSLTAKLVDAEKKAKTKAATVEVTVGGVSLADPFGAGEARPGQGHLNYQIDDGPVVSTAMKKLSFHELRSGNHKIRVSLSTGEHESLAAEQTLEVTVP